MPVSYTHLDVYKRQEILFAISRGCQVFGGASMGALRAAECRSFGIRGVGTVYAAYADGELEDDDEVAVSHLDAAFGYECLTVPMVTVRAALSAAVSVGLLPERDHERALKAAKNVFYADRTWDAVSYTHLDVYKRQSMGCTR